MLCSHTQIHIHVNKCVHMQRERESWTMFLALAEITWFHYYV